MPKGKLTKGGLLLSKESKQMLDEVKMDCQSVGVRGLTNVAENLTAGGIYLARLTITNKCWYKVTKQEIEQDKVEVLHIDTGTTKYWYKVTIQEIEQYKVGVFCINTGVTKKVEKKFIKELPDRY